MSAHAFLTHDVLSSELTGTTSSAPLKTNLILVTMSTQPSPSSQAMSYNLITIIGIAPIVFFVVRVLFFL